MVKKHLLLAGIAISVAGTGFAAASDSFNEQQTKQIQQITKEYLLNNPQILVEVSQKLQEQQEQQLRKLEENARRVIPQYAKDLFNNQNSPVVGNASGDVSVVEFFDYQCGHCKEMTEVMNTLEQKDSNLRIIYKEFPIFGQSSVYASKAALAANKQGKYKEMHEALMETNNPLTVEKVMAAAKQVGLNAALLQKDMNSDEIKNELNDNMRLAQKLGIMGTPAFIIGSTSKASNKDSKSFFLPGSTSPEVLQGLIIEVRNGGDSKKKS